MKKLFLSLMSLLLCFSLALPVYADVLTGPELWFDFNDGPGYIVVGVIVLLVAFILYRLLRKRNK